MSNGADYIYTIRINTHRLFQLNYVRNDLHAYLTIGAQQSTAYHVLVLSTRTNPLTLQTAFFSLSNHFYAVATDLASALNPPGAPQQFEVEAQFTTGPSNS
jgi:hypothetical protein